MNKGWIVLKWAVLGLLFVSLLGWGTMMLWNWLVPDLFHGPVIGFWQALGLLMLSKVLFSGFGGKRHCDHGHHPAGNWKNRLYSRYSSMTPEDREVFKKKMKEKWCRYDAEPSGKKSGTSND